MDLNKLRTAVFEKTGIRIDTNDPVFALVALNEAVLTECVEQHVAVLHQATAKLSEQTRHLLEAGERHKKLLQQMASTVEAGNAPGIAVALAREDDERSDAQPSMGPSGAAPWRALAGAAGVALLSAALTVGGLRALKEGAPAAPLAQKMAGPAAIPQLTPEQLVLIKNGEKFDRMWAQLDDATKARIQATVEPR